MANIQPYIDQILNAVYGEEVRSSIVNALEKVNDDNNSYADLKKEVIAAKDAVGVQRLYQQHSLQLVFPTFSLVLNALVKT